MRRDSLKVRTLRDSFMPTEKVLIKEAVSLSKGHSFCGHHFCLYS